MDRLTRRRFLVASGIAAGTALAGGATAITWNTLVERSDGNPAPMDERILVLVTLYGGNDGLNTVVPAADPAYHDARPELAYAEHEVLPLADGLGLNPGMRRFKELWDADRLAVVRGVSYPEPNRSHFRSMAIWQTGSPSSSVSTGWVGRWLDLAGGDPLLALALDPVLPPMLAGEAGAGATLAITGMQLPGGPLGDGIRALGKPADGEHPLSARAATACRDLVRTSELLARSGTGTSGRPDEGEQKPRGVLAAQLDVVRRCIELGAPTRVYSVSLGGFDTHADELGTQQRLLTELDGAVGDFLDRAGPNVVVAVYSEFGRRVTANASDGTDHGTAGPVFLAGTPVRGGLFYGDQPSLTDLDAGDLKVTVDFRDVYATLLADVLRTDPARILDGRLNRLDLFHP